MSGGVDPSRRAAALAALREHFVRPTLGDWAILWPEMPKRVAAVALWTHLDVARDPVVGLLRQWLAAGAPPDAVPRYPNTAAQPLDLRPAEPVPPALRSSVNDQFVWAALQHAGLKAVLAPYMQLFCQSADRITPAAVQPADERLRQFRRITRDGAIVDLTFKTLAECLGWFAGDALVPQDAGLVHVLTKELLRTPLPTTENASPEGIADASRWYIKAGKRNPALWRWPLCLAAMRTAAVYVSRLKLAGANVDFLAKAIVGARAPTPPREGNRGACRQ